MVAQGSLWEHPGHPKRPQSAQNISILHKYFAHRFLRASWPALWPKLAQNYMSETVFGLRRRERIACWPFSQKLTPGSHFWRILAPFWVPNRGTLGILGPTMPLFFGAGCEVVVRAMEPSRPSPNSYRVRGQSLSIRLGIWLDLLYLRLAVNS